ncbi:5'-3' exonuclease, partial [Bacillus haynesii]|nr:5'-3' exonuclease [Bacillus haynesii]
MNKKLLIIDGIALLLRYLFANEVHRYFMLNDKGVPTNGVHV